MLKNIFFNNTHRVNIRISNANKCPNKKLFLLSHDFEKLNLKMTARPLTVIPLKVTSVSLRK
jgi:tmRNA-binding protein